MHHCPQVHTAEYPAGNPETRRAGSALIAPSPWHAPRPARPGRRRRARSPPSGKGVLKRVSPTDGESLALEIQMRNATRRARPGHAGRGVPGLPGGMVVVSARARRSPRGGSSSGTTRCSTPGEYSYEFAYRHSTPVSHYLLALQLTRPGQPPHDYLLQVPFVRRGFADAAARCTPRPRSFIALQEPIEVFALADGEVWLPIVGQVINTSGRPLTLKTWKIRVKDAAGKALLDRDLSTVFRVERASESINEFLFAFVLPREFRKGTLRIDAEAELGGRRVPLLATAEVERIEPHAIRSPVEGRWSLGQRAGRAEFHTHYRFPEQRYAYDLRILGGAAPARPPRATRAGTRAISAGTGRSTASRTAR